MFKDTSATRKVFQLSQRIRAVAGGTSASKTISILVWLIDYAQTNQNKLITVVSESYPHLSKGAMLDFERIMKDTLFWDDKQWHGTNHEYTFPTGSKIEFYSVDTYGKAHGPRRDVLFMNECNNLAYNIVDQLITRTREIVWLDWNPTSSFWFYEDMQPFRDDIDFITLTYKDNEALDEVTIKEIESHKHNKSWWQVYGLGQLGEVESRIYTGWVVIDEVPKEARLERRGQDFGYSNDPAAVLDIYRYNRGFVLDERLYRKGMSNKDLANMLLSLDEPDTEVYADSSEPKSIAEIEDYGVPILAAQKGPGSVSQGIRYIQDQRIMVTKRSVNLLKEYRGYLWETDREGNITNKPQDFQNHLMDALRYGLETYYFNQGREAALVTPKPPNPQYKQTPYEGQEDQVIIGQGLDVQSILQGNNRSGRDWRSN